MKKTILIDTNLYLDDPNIIYKLANAKNKILIPMTVLKELDKHKFNKDLSYSARGAIRAILDFMISNPDQIEFDTTKYEGEPDERIIQSAKNVDAVIATKDVSMSIQAKSLGLESILHDIVLNNIFKPYIHMTMYELLEASDEDTFAYGNEYVDDEYEDVLTIVSKIAGYEVDPDTWFFVIIDVEKKEPIVYANNPLQQKLVRIDSKKKYRVIETEGSTIEARDCYQICAIYAMVEAPNVVICGSYGSGKSLLASAYAIAYHSDKKTFISRPNLTVDRRFELGFLPGRLEEKLYPWMAGFMSSLYYIFSNTKGQRMSNGLTYDHVKDQIFNKYFEMTPLDSLQGMSFMEEDLLLLDEVQLCSIPILATVLSRFGEGSKIIMMGDVKQAYGVIPPSENGLLKLLRLMPSKYLAYVELKNNYRSKLIEIADKLQNKSLS